MQDDIVGVSSLEPQSRPAANVLVVLAESPAPAPVVHNTEARIAAGDALSVALPPSSSNGIHPDPAESQPHETAVLEQHALYKLLVPSGHMVTWTTRTDWSLDVGAGRNESKFDVILVESDTNGKTSGKTKDTAVQIIRDLRNAPIGRFASILAVLPSHRRGDKARRQIDALNSAGADDFITLQATVIEAESRMRAMAGLARVRAELEGARDQLRLQLQTDDLTKLLNRRFFFQNAHREVGRARRYNSDLSCLMVEIDHYKKLCLMIGYESGDIMLRALAQVLRDLTRDSDIVARFGDEKFVALLPETSIEGATMLREKIQLAMSKESLDWNDQQVPISVSIGEANRYTDVVALQDSDSGISDETDGQDSDEMTALSTREELAELLKAADSALFVAKRGVRLPTFFVDVPSKRIPDGQDLPSQLPSL